MAERPELEELPRATGNEGQIFLAPRAKAMDNKVIKSEVVDDTEDDDMEESDGCDCPGVL